jgi:zinc transporter 5/7
MCSIGLPIYASLKVGGFLVAFALLLSTASGVPNLVQAELRGSSSEKYSQKVLTIALLASVMILSFFGLNQPWDSAPFMGYLALLTSVFVISPPFPSLRHQGPIPEPGLVAESISKAKSAGNRSAIVVTTDAPLALVSGVFLLFLGIIVSRGLPFQLSELLYILVPAVLLAISLMVSFPTGLRSPDKHGLAVCTGAAAILCSPHVRDEILPVYAARCILAVVSFFASRMDDSHLRLDAHSRNHTHNHAASHSHVSESTTRITKWVIRRSEPYPLLYSIVKEKDSRSIFYFMW